MALLRRLSGQRPKQVFALGLALLGDTVCDPSRCPAQAQMWVLALPICGDEASRSTEEVSARRRSDPFPPMRSKSPPEFGQLAPEPPCAPKRKGTSPRAQAPSQGCPEDAWAQPKSRL